VTAGHSSSQGYQSCCQVNQAKYILGQAQVTIEAQTSIGIRNDNHKIVQNTTQQYNSSTNSCSNVVTNEFYQIDQAAPSPKLDNPGSANQLNPASSSSLTAIYNSLMSQLNSILSSQPACPGDANIDGVVNAEDLSIWQKLLSWALSSVADFNLDGLTNSADGQIIRGNNGTCPKATAVY
jgi:hypothetical protein